MNRYTIFADIAGRVSLDTTGNPRVTAAAVIIESIRVEEVRTMLPPSLPKWQACSVEAAERVVRLIASEAASVAAVSIDRDTPAWKQFWKDAEGFQAAIVAQDRHPAGFAKAANITVFWLFGCAFALAIAHAIKTGSRDRLVDHLGRELIERSIVCDSDIQGPDNIATFQSFWDRHDNSQPLAERLGLRFTTRSVQVTTEQQEPMLLLADYVAGIVHMALLTNPGRISPPLPDEETKRLFEVLGSSEKTLVHSDSFALNYSDIFGEVLRHVDEDSRCRQGGPPDRP